MVPRARTLAQVFKQLESNLQLDDAALMQQLAKIPGGTESLSPPMLRALWQTILDNRLVIAETFNTTNADNKSNGVAIMHEIPITYELEKTQESDPQEYRSFNAEIICNPYSNEFFLIASTKSKRYDGTKYGFELNDETMKVEYPSGLNFERKIGFEVLYFDGLGAAPEPWAELVPKRKTGNKAPPIGTEVAAIINTPDLAPYITQNLVARVTREDLSYYLQYSAFKPQDMSSLFDNPNLGLRERLEFFIKLLEAVAALHKAGVVHLDLKPENVHINGQHVTLGDFDQAKCMGNPITPQGTAHYAAPEILKAIYNICIHNEQLDRLQDKIIPDLTQKSYAYNLTSATLNKLLDDPHTQESVEAEKLNGKEDSWSLGIMLLEIAHNKRIDELADTDPNATDRFAAGFKDLDAELASIVTDMLRPYRDQRKPLDEIKQRLKQYSGKLEKMPTASLSETSESGAFPLKEFLQRFRTEPAARVELAQAIFHYLGRFTMHSDDRIDVDTFKNSEQDLKAFLEKLRDAGLQSPRVQRKSALVKHDSAEQKTSTDVMPDSTWRALKTRGELLPLTADFMLRVMQPQYSRTPLLKMKGNVEHTTALLNKIVELDGSVTPKLSFRKAYSSDSPKPN